MNSVKIKTLLSQEKEKTDKVPFSKKFREKHMYSEND